MRCLSVCLLICSLMAAERLLSSRLSRSAVPPVLFFFFFFVFVARSRNQKQIQSAGLHSGVSNRHDEKTKTTKTTTEEQRRREGGCDKKTSSGWGL